MATYVNDLRLTELATGEGSGTWGTTTNTNLELIGEALGYATQQAFGSDADTTTTVADGVSDPARAMYYKVTSAVSLTATRTLTIAPNTLSRVMFIENATTGSQSIAISQGSGANVTIAAGKTAVVYLDGAGATAAVVDAMAGVDPGVTDTLAEVLVAGNTSGGTNIELTTTDKVQFRDTAIYINSSADGQLDIVADTEVQIAATTIDVNGTLAFDSLKGTGATTVTNILDEDNMGSDSATALATQQSIKAYVDSQVGSFDTLAEVLAQGNTTGGTDIAVSTGDDITFADSSKAIFGAGSDLQIYHDASDSIINDNGTGSLKLQQGGSTKLEVTGTGIDVTGTVTADGLTVDGAATVTANLDVGADNGLGGKLSIQTSSYGVLQDMRTLVAGGINPYLTISSSADGITFEENGSVYKSLMFKTGAIERMRIDANGNAIFTKSGGAYLQLADATAVRGAINVSTSDGLIFTTGSSFTERMRIDASGNLLVGGTSAYAASAITMTQDGILYTRRSGGSPATFRRDSDDGSIVTLEKDGTTVGSIVTSGGDLAIGTGNTKLRFNDASDAIYSGGGDGSGTNAGTDLGTSDYNFGDLYLSGGALTSTVKFLANTTVSGSDATIFRPADNTMAFSTNGAERMRITSSGSVGIGTDSPYQAKLDVKGIGSVAQYAATNSSSDQVLIGTVDRGVTPGFTFLPTGSSFVGVVGSGLSQTLGICTFGSSPVVFGTANTERMRLDSSGNLLVGKTGSDTLGTAGHELHNSGMAHHTRATGTVLYLNRTGNDGVIADFRKDNVTVGSIGSFNSGTEFFLASGDTGIKAIAGIDAVTPSGTAGANRDGFVNLGWTTNRFKDLYLSGGAYLGGTVAANLLDDYEEGTWTPTFGATTNPTMTYNTQSAVYTKVGNLVSVTCKIITATRSGGSGQLTVDGLPFTVAANVDSPIYIGFNYNWTTPPNGGSCQQGTNHVLLYSSIENNTSSFPVDILASGNSYLIFSATYRTNA